MGGSSSVRVHPAYLKQSPPGRDSLTDELTEAIREGRLDRIEELIQAPLPSRLLPLHIAAAYASFEALEILVSAGFGLEAVDHLVRSALHKCATNRSEASALCACFLATRAPRLLLAEDQQGHTPLDSAVLRHNREVFSTLLHLLGPEEQGLVERTRLLALRLRHEDMVSDLDRLIGPADKAAKPDSRTLQVWERFLQNALTLAEARDRTRWSGGFVEEEPEEEPGEEPEEEPEEESKLDSEVDFFSSEELPLVPRLDLDTLEFCLSCTAIYSEEEVFVVQRNYDYYATLVRHVDDYGLRPEWEDIQLPTTLQLAVSRGWVSFYDCLENDAFWYNVFTGQTERYLPIAADYALHQLTGLLAEDEFWLSPDYSPCYSWMLMLDEENSDGRSFYNYRTGEPTRFNCSLLSYHVRKANSCSSSRHGGETSLLLKADGAYAGKSLCLLILELF